MEGRKKELHGIAEKVQKSIRRDVKEKSLMLPITEVVQLSGRAVPGMQQTRRVGTHGEWT